MPRNQSYSLFPDEDEGGTQLFVTYSSTPFLVQAGNPSSGVSIGAAQLNHSGTYTFGEVLPADAQVDVLQQEAAR